MDRGAWRLLSTGSQSQTRLKRLSLQACTHVYPHVKQYPLDCTAQTVYTHQQAAQVSWIFAAGRGGVRFSDRVWRELERGSGRRTCDGKRPCCPLTWEQSQKSSTASSQDKGRCFALIKTNKDFSVLNRLIFLDTKVRRKRTLSHSVHKNKDSA